MIRPTFFFLAIASCVGSVCIPACGGSDADVAGGSLACTNAALPAPTTDCKVAGSYRFQTTPRCPNTCDVKPSSFGPVVVTTDGMKATAKFQDTASDGTLVFFQLDCKLNGCDCTGLGHFVFTPDGLVGEGSSSTAREAGMCSYTERLTAVRR